MSHTNITNPFFINFLIRFDQYNIPEQLLSMIFALIPFLQAIFISRISEGGAADRTGVLQVGDKVLEVSVLYTTVILVSQRSQVQILTDQ